MPKSLYHRGSRPTLRSALAITLGVLTLAIFSGCASSSVSSQKKSSSVATKTQTQSASTKTTTSKTKKTSSGSSSSSKTTTVKGKVYKGQASYYADKFHGKATASGEKYDKTKMTCAHRTFAFGTVLRVTNTANGKSVAVRVNDRGPVKEGRIVDVSRAAANKLDMISAGVINCTVQVISEP